jgi:hypothetical protein
MSFMISLIIIASEKSCESRQKPPGNIDAVLPIGRTQEGILISGSTKDVHTANYKIFFIIIGI